MDASPVVAALIVAGFAVTGLAATDAYFRRVRLAPPQLGVLNLFDVGVMLAMVVVVPYLYLLMPAPALTVLLVAAVASVLHLGLEPLAPKPVPAVVVTAVLVAELVVYWTAGPGAVTYVAINNLVVGGVAVATANLWVQSGLRARRAALLAGALAVYDLVFTTFLGVTGDLFEEAADHPLAPLLAWPAGPDGQVILGQGDLLFAAAFPIVARKAYGSRAAAQALVATVAVLGLLLTLAVRGNLPGTFPVMVVLGPTQVLLWLRFRRTYGPERAMAEYRRARAAPVSADVPAAPADTGVPDAAAQGPDRPPMERLRCASG